MKCGKIFGVFVCALWVLPVAANAVSVNATITADNHYAMYYGNSNGSGMTLVGGNEYFQNGLPVDPVNNPYNWSHPEVFNFNIISGQDIFIAAWSDAGSSEGLLGEFSLDGNAVYTTADDATGWEYIHAGTAYGDGSIYPTTGEMTGYVSAATWLDVTQGKPNGSAPWGAIPGISLSADWIWGGPLNTNNPNGDFYVFRLASVPEPSSMILLGSAIFGEVLRRKRKSASA